MGGQLLQCLRPVHQRHQAVQAELRGQQCVAGQGLHHRCGVGQARGLDDQAVKVRDLPCMPAREEIA